MTPKDSRHRLPQTYKISKSSLEQKFSNDKWTFQQVPPTNGSLHSPIIDSNGYLYVYRLYVDKIWNYNTHDNYDSTYTLQIFKLSSLSFDIVWHQMLIDSAKYLYMPISTGSKDPQDITYYMSNITDKEYIIADTSNYLFILNATNGDIIHSIALPGVWLTDTYHCPDQYNTADCISDMRWYIDDNLIRLLTRAGFYSGDTYKAYLTTYSIENNIESNNLLRSSSTSLVDLSQFIFFTRIQNNTKRRMMFSTEISSTDANGYPFWALYASIVNNDSTTTLWTNTDFICFWNSRSDNVVVNDALQRVYVLGFKSYSTTEEAVFLYSVNFDGKLINRYPLSNDWEMKGSNMFTAPFFHFALSYDGKHLYVYVLYIKDVVSDVSWNVNNYLIHFAINGDDISASKIINIIPTYMSNGNNDPKAQVKSIAVDGENKLYVWVVNSDLSSSYIIYDTELSKLWTQKHTNLVQSSWGAYDHRTYTTFDISLNDYWYIMDAFSINTEYANDNEYSMYKNGYFKIDVYGSVVTKDVIYEWKFWLSLGTTISSLLFFILLQIYEKNTILKQRVLDNYRRMSDDSDTTKIVLYIRRLKICVRIIGLVVLGVLITMIHFEKIDIIHSYLDTIGTYDSVRDTYLINSKSVASSMNYTYKDLCFCSDSSLDINKAQCTAGNCYTTKHNCGDIINHLGYCDLTWYKQECNCEFLVNGCNITIDYNTSIHATLPDMLYDNCVNSYHLLYKLLWWIYGIHIGFSVIYILSAIVTCGKTLKIGWVTRISSFATLVLLLLFAATASSGTLCTGQDKLLGVKYPGCNYVYPDDFDQTFQQSEAEAYGNIVSVLLLYGMKTTLKFVQVWIPFSCTAHDFCFVNR
eukprot:460681_1